MVDSAHKRNFCIIAHIDHGKSTLADRFIEKARLVTTRGPEQTQILDNMDIERERGITIKSQAVTIPYTARNGELYELNLVDTPGHVDFSYEVSRAISSFYCYNFAFHFSSYKVHVYNLYYFLHFH